MARLTLDNEVTEFIPLDSLIPMYALNKVELDSYTALCKKENEEIKRQMLELGQDVYRVNGYTAKRTVSNRESLNEDKLMAVILKHGIKDVIKTREYVDMDALENYLYHTEMTPALAADLESCKSTTEVVTLRVTKDKKKGD
jgi:hypothetical protein